MANTVETTEKLAGEFYIPPDITPEKLFQELGRIRREAEDTIERLIQFLDDTDPYAAEIEDDAGSNPEGEDTDSEPSLASAVGIDQVHWAAGQRDDCEGDGCADDREGDEELHGGDGALEDGEASLGWTEEEAGRGGTGGSFMGNRADFEDAPSTLTAAALARHRQFDRYRVNNDGWHVDSEHWFGDQRRLRNLSDRQRLLVRPKVDRGSLVSCC